MPSRKRSTRRTNNRQKVNLEEELATLENLQRFRSAQKRAAQRQLQESAKEAEKQARELEQLEKEIAVGNWVLETPDCEKPFAFLSVEEIRQTELVKLSTQAEWNALAATGDPKAVERTFNKLVAVGFRANEACNPVEFETEIQANETFEMYLARLKTTLHWIDQVENEHGEKGDIADTTQD